MDTCCVILACLLLIQMALILIMLNPVYDVKKISQYLDISTKTHRKLYFCCVSCYFITVVYLGMYIPLQSIHKLIFSDSLNEFEKMILLSRIEKNYIIAGFSLFLVVVMYGVRALVSYTVSLMELTDNEVVLESESKVQKKLNTNILANLLKVKRSVSYETILFTNEIREQLKAVIRNVEFPHNKCALSSILESPGITI
ncbi:uncharacterized protein LOC113510743 [Galleria mellonella]|uniref:Uncharacterized protein LOC113510743 n=1 Tax=Galleria mellonella TaxID=7137 RepID=A0ABM3ML75_GALME|nr:uncharacterized protein LOC113510743 [Galleria mellonella]